MNNDNNDRSAVKTSFAVVFILNCLTKPLLITIYYVVDSYTVHLT